LCIDDNVLLLAMRKALLESSDFKVFIAENGPAGLDLATREPIDVVILDYSMPGMDGGTVARELRRRCPNIAILLSSGIEETPESMLALMDGVVAKGTPSATLIQEIERVATAKTKPLAQFPTIEVDREGPTEFSRRFARSKQLRARRRQQRRS
jgi:CheY-like chemotaxis protein